jgi:hypothetical protein
MGFLKRLFTTKNGFLTLVSVAAPVVVSVVTGGVFTVPVLVTALGSIAGKLAASPMNHDTENNNP